ncbi:hypothetical protein J7W19_27365 [Streptomyces mobaraensis NBRC 13819 = DSM 40847]|uniref:hypothetical protein n=1 Tax=Streptomyces mobaraensis TaxID=35621 RepID=UPI000D0AA372|nr:hypothetical protein [Streptomyces mobaraensis]QTT76602.1 hypothetical protein J7W19_27365 [Streptomyces mobaraensis NBRC 13819 = DSM 40847]
MSSFTVHLRRVHDERLPARTRRSDLRSCLVHFAPYGFRATYHHLTLSARIPGNVEHDPAALIRAADELHAARRLWLAHVRDRAADRRADKALGRRHEPTGDAWRAAHGWRAWRRGWNNIAFCPDPVVHPTAPLPAVIEHVIHWTPPADGTHPPTCRACGEPGGDGYGPAPGGGSPPTVCGRCGVRGL